MLRSASSRSSRKRHIYVWNAWCESSITSTSLINVCMSPEGWHQSPAMTRALSLLVQGLDKCLWRSGSALSDGRLQRWHGHAYNTVKFGGLVVKAWAKASRVIDSRNGYLSSYAVVLMWISYLLKRAQLRYIPPESILHIPYHPCGSYHVPLTLDTVKFEEVQNLVEGFFVYYTEEFSFETSVVTLRKDSGMALRAEPRLRWLGQDFLCIEDPYENSINLGRKIDANKFAFVERALQAEREKHHGFRSAVPTQPTWEGLQHSGPPNDSGQAPLIKQRLIAPSNPERPSGLSANAISFFPAELLGPISVQNKKLREIPEPPTMSPSSVPPPTPHRLQRSLRCTARSRGFYHTLRGSETIWCCTRSLRMRESDNCSSA